MPEGIGYPETGAQPASEGGDPMKKIDFALKLLNSVLTDDVLEDDDELILEQATTLLQKVRATTQQLQDKALGVTPQAKFMRRQQGGGGGAPSGAPMGMGMEGGAY